MYRALIVLMLLASPLLAQPVLAPPVLAQTAPAGAPETQAARKLLTNQLLDALKLAPDESTAALLEGRIRSIWLNSGTPAVSLLMSRGLRELQASTPADALDDINAALDLQPDLASAWTLRASAQFDSGDVQGAIGAIEQALRLEPRQFDALQTLSRIAESRNDWKGAYAAWVKLCEIDPKTASAASRLLDLRRRALGDEL